MSNGIGNDGGIDFDGITLYPGTARDAIAGLYVIAGKLRTKALKLYTGECERNTYNNRADALIALATELEEKVEAYEEYTRNLFSN